MTVIIFPVTLLEDQHKAPVLADVYTFFFFVISLKVILVVWPGKPFFYLVILNLSQCDSGIENKG